MNSGDTRYNQDKLTDLSPFEDVKVFIIGAGAVGSYASGSIAMTGIKLITQNDNQHYEADNAAKTSPLIHLSKKHNEDAGRWKAVAMAERLEDVMRDGGNSNYIVGSIDDLGPMAFSEYDYVCAAPDNKAVREYINQQLKMLPPDKRPAYIVGGTDGEMASSAIFTDLDTACYRCMCEEHSFRSSRRRTSCADAQYRFVDGKEEQIIVSNLSSQKAAIMMADDLRSSVTGKLIGKNRLREWNPDTPFPPIAPNEIKRKPGCPDCKNISYPEHVEKLKGCTLTSTLQDVFEQLQAIFSSDDFALAVHMHFFGEDIFNEFVKSDYCRSCGEIFDVYSHTRSVDSEHKLLCKACRNKMVIQLSNKNNGNPDSIYGFSPENADARMLNSTLFELGYPIGAYLHVTYYNGAFDCSDSDIIKEYLFYMEEDPQIVKHNINLMEVNKNGE